MQSFVETFLSVKKKKKTVKILTVFEQDSTSDAKLLLELKQTESKILI